LIEKYCTDGTNWNPGEYAFILKKYQERENNWRDDIHQWFEQESIELERGHEYAAYIMNAMEGGTPFRFNGNVPNMNLISNLPVNACVEVPVWASRKGLEPVAVGALPPQVAALTNLSSQIEEMAVEAILTNNQRLIYQAVANSPLTAAVLSLAEIKEMVNEMLEKNRDYLP
jgi:alpha-galactosidase